MFPIPVKELDGRYILTDGHTRAVWAAQNDFRDLKVVLDMDDPDWDANRICVGWCIQAGIYGVMDLATRIIAHHDYETLWIERCQRMHTKLAAARHSLHFAPHTYSPYITDDTAI